MSRSTRSGIACFTYTLNERTPHLGGICMGLMHTAFSPSSLQVFRKWVG